ncbi:MAG: 1-deoxy-D-xylulose 5-phosphate reductoisomerase [Candidatus Binatia bacterium]|nr:MAG: 1-deoxy-D-xylulose 5-phosphate reductoisomerase [Candidatus Binatia bacterium]
MKRISILGSTGSIGRTTLSVVERFPERFRVVGLAAGSNLDCLAEQVVRFRPSVVSVSGASEARELRRRVGACGTEIVFGSEGLLRVAREPADLLVSALVGALGLVPTFAAIEAGADVALANKEVLVVGGELVTKAAEKAGVRLLPTDSEHNAIFQALQGSRREDVRRIVLTASGGPFRGKKTAELEGVTPEEALRHPTWKMGAKITVDSATLMNKGFEVIEAHWLFEIPPDRIEVWVHPQSIVHSLVEFRDGSSIAQLGIPDMAIPISYVLGYPERLEMDHLPRLDLPSAGPLTFEPPDLETFPCLALAYEAVRVGGTAPAVLNAANEVLVDAFLSARIRFLDIPRLLRLVLERHEPAPARTLEAILEADRWARAEAKRLVDGRL